MTDTNDVESLGKFVEDVKSGKVKSFVVVVIHTDGQAQFLTSDITNPYTTLGAVEHMKYELTRSIAAKNF